MPNRYSIQFVSKVTGINAHTIRAWEKRYKAVDPDRDQNGRRLYTQDHVDRLVMLQELVSFGNNISDVANLGPDDLKDMFEKYVGQDLEKSLGAKKTIDTNHSLSGLLLALSCFKIDVIHHELQKLHDSLGPREFAIDILSPLLSEVGQQVQTGRLGIAQEHALSSIIRFHVGQNLFRNFNFNNNTNINVMIAAPEGELHEFGILIAALLCKHYRYNTFYLGPNMPAKALVEALNQVRPSLLIVGVSDAVNNFPSDFVENYMTDLVELGNPNQKIWFGGPVALNSAYIPENVSIIPNLEELDAKLQKLE